MTAWELSTDVRTHASTASPSRYKTAEFLVDPVLIASCQSLLSVSIKDPLYSTAANSAAVVLSGLQCHVEPGDCHAALFVCERRLEFP
ncbi:hypothetical protein J3E68DRAFT_405212 [Trichoderma sp. SZMC 28012]